MLRVIAGELGGRRLRVPSGSRTRPTADRVRESLFSILGPPPLHAAALDLYAGSGALGIEALSRGVDRAVFVEQDLLASRILATNLQALQLGHRAQVLSRPVRAALPQVTAHGPFHWVFADPPYASDELPALLTLLGPLLSPDGVFVFEGAARDADALCGSIPLDASFRLLDRRRYGDTALLFFGLLGENP
jgi:16S rRNA (guanine966-N2)-methyltransferase